MPRNKFSFLRGGELLACREMLDKMENGHQKDFAEELYRRFEQIHETLNSQEDFSQQRMDDAVNGKL